MAYKHSTAVDQETLEKSGCFTTLHVRKSNYESISVASSHQIFEEYNRLVGTADIIGGGYDPQGHMVSLCFPECLPSRVDVTTRLTEAGFLHDGNNMEPNAKYSPDRGQKR